MGHGAGAGAAGSHGAAPGRAWGYKGKGSKRSLPALQMGQTPGGLSRAQR